MKVNDSGMPEETYWNSLFDLAGIVDWLALPQKTVTVAELGCGYGTFAVPITKRLKGEIYAFDIELSMLEVAQKMLERLA